MKKKILSGFILFLPIGIACIMVLAFSEPETPVMTDAIRGKWALKFEKTFREALPISAVNRDLQSRAGHMLFHQERKRAVVGTEGWLFMDDEFSCPDDYQQNLIDNLLYIYKTKQALEEKNIRLIVTLAPEKAPVFAKYLGVNILPPCRGALYRDVNASFLKNGLAVTDLLPVMQSSARENSYFNAGIPRSPAGARIAERASAELVRIALPP